MPRNENQLHQPQLMPQLNFVSQLYAQDCPEACLLAEYPCSNCGDTCFQNDTRFTIHDPFPPPPRELLKVLGPHHLMFGWGNSLPVASEVPPPQSLVYHWKRMLGESVVPRWQPASFDPASPYITLFPHQSLPANGQVIDPEVNYELHSKCVIEKIVCPQARVLEEIEFPCVVKLTHGYAGLGNYIVKSQADERAMRAELKKRWPQAQVVINSVIDDIVGDYGVQFYLRPDGSTIWLGVTEQNFNSDLRWCGGVYRSHLQRDLYEQLSPFVTATARHLSERQYHGIGGIDVLKTGDGKLYLVDVNPRLTGITPFLMASRIFDRDDGLTVGLYQASRRSEGSIDQLINNAERVWLEQKIRVVVLSAVESTGEDGSPITTCHLSASAQALEPCREALEELVT